MSDVEGRTLGDRVEAAISEHLAAEGGGWATSFYVCVNLVNADGEQDWAYATPTDQLLTTTLGLIEWSRGVAQHEQRSYLRDLGDE